MIEGHTYSTTLLVQPIAYSNSLSACFLPPKMAALPCTRKKWAESNNPYTYNYNYVSLFCITTITTIIMAPMRIRRRILAGHQTLFDYECTFFLPHRSNPDILRSNLDEDDIKGGNHSWTETLRLHADAGSRVQTPMGSTEELNELIHSSTSS